MLMILYKTNLQIGQKPQNKNRYTEPDVQKVNNNLKLIGTEKKILERLLLTKALRSTTHKWDFMKLKGVCMAKDTIIPTKWQSTE